MTRPLVIAHRGASAVELENSLAAFRAAARLGADGVELDVHASADGELFVHHDETVDGSHHIAHTAAGKIRALRIANGEPVPTLAEALAAWDAMAETPAVLFNRGMARLFLGQITDAKPALQKAIDAIPETSGWNALARLYLAVALSLSSTLIVVNFQYRMQRRIKLPSYQVNVHQCGRGDREVIAVNLLYFANLAGDGDWQIRQRLSARTFSILDHFRDITNVKEPDRRSAVCIRHLPSNQTRFNVRGECQTCGKLAR